MKPEKTKKIIAEIKDFEELLCRKYEAVVILTFDVKPFTLPALLEAVNQSFQGYTKNSKVDITIRTSSGIYVLFRHIFIYIACEANYSRQEIGEFLGMDQSTMTNGYHKIKDKIEKSHMKVIQIVEQINIRLLK